MLSRCFFNYQTNYFSISVTHTQKTSNVMKQQNVLESCQIPVTTICINILSLLVELSPFTYHSFLTYLVYNNYSLYLSNYKLRNITLLFFINAINGSAQSVITSYY
jgi:hypothetical protein